MRAIIPERYRRGILRALVVSNMLPDASHPERGRFVRDQVTALRALGSLEVDLFEFGPGARALASASTDLLRRRRTGPAYEVVHAHFGLSAWPALAVRARVRALTVHGTDVMHPRTRLATFTVLPRMDIVAAVSQSLLAELPARARRRALVLPCGVDMERFQPSERALARAELGLEESERYLLFPADPARPEKRADLARALADSVAAKLLTLGGVAPDRVPLFVNAANAVVVPSDREGFGLAVLEALACDTPVLATPVGIHPAALAGVSGALCAPFELERWREAVRPHLDALDGRIAGRDAAIPYSAGPMAVRVRDAWQAALDGSG
jgi:teichuronic acid biosynthesis glycosyltransferase TuaC